MPTLLLRFRARVHHPRLPVHWIGSGPLFHRWLPDGEKDAIPLDTGEPDVELRVWFERLGFVDDGRRIVFDPERREVDPDIMRTQAVLGAGPLAGSLEIRGLAEDEVAAVRADRVGHADYVSLAKRIVKTLLVPHVNRLLRILRVNYGQYWIAELEEWDSRYHSLSQYCESFLGLTWSLDEGETWAAFRPGGRMRTDGPKPGAKLYPDSYRDYLTEADWRQLGSLIRDGYEPTTGALVLAQAHQFLDRGDVRQAIIEGVCALEVAVHEFVRENLHGHRGLAESMQAFWNLPLVSQVVVVTTILGEIPNEDIEHSVALVNMRNRILHEGWVPPEDAATHLTGLMSTTVALLSSPSFRFPTFYPAVAFMSAEEWDDMWKWLAEPE